MKVLGSVFEGFARLLFGVNMGLVLFMPDSWSKLGIVVYGMTLYTMASTTADIVRKR